MRRQRLHEGSDGQGLIEVVGVLGTFVVLLAIGVPSYFGFQNGKAEQQAKDSLLAAVPAVQVYHAKRGSYAGLDTVDLMRIDPRVSATLVVGKARRGRFCLMETVHGQVWRVAGPTARKATFSSGSCPHRA
jgi:Tfp pilus assembly protein PilE